MTCNNCALGISKSLKQIGFDDADANFIDGEVSFSSPSERETDKAIAQIKKLGYTVKDDSSPIVENGLSSIEKKFIFSLIFSVPLFMHMFVPHHWWINNPWVQLALALPVFILGILHFGKSAWGSLRAGMANMDVLIFIGSSSAFLYSLVGWYMHAGTPELHNFLFFETATTIISLVLLGNVLEHRSVQQTTKNVQALDKMQAHVARIVMRVGKTEKIFETDPAGVKPGDELQINEGDQIPVDGVVLSGSGEVNESAITGESLPNALEEGRAVYSGTTLVNGNLRMIAKAPAKDSTLQQIIELVKKARKDQPDIQKFGDRVSGVFVPAVLVIAALTFTIGYFFGEIGLTHALMNAVAVLVISCPCAMGLATPTAVVAGVGRAAKNGILIKGGSTLERFAKVKRILFDKTGTLTSGDFQIIEVENSIGDRAKSIIHAIEQHSAHPIASSFLKEFGDFPPEALTDTREEKGRGMTAKTASGESVRFGRCTNADADLALEIDGVTVASYLIRDKVLEGAREMVAYYNSADVVTELISGDRDSKVKSTAEELGISKWAGSLSPQEKLDRIEAASKKELVAMVGDGINDGPALSLAHVGISPKGATALASDAARIAILSSDPMDGLKRAHLISKHTYITIKQNLFWALSYNLIAIPIAAFGFLNPMVAALAMAFSDVVVIGNSLRLKVKRLK